MNDFIDMDNKVLLNEMRRNQHINEKKIKREEVLSGIREPVDKNFNKLVQGQTVYLKKGNGPVIVGTIRLAKAKDSYIVEEMDGSVVSYDRLLPNQRITSTKPYVFDIMRPNHNEVFMSLRDLELYELDLIINISKRRGLTPLKFIENLNELVEKYPEEFV